MPDTSFVTSMLAKMRLADSKSLTLRDVVLLHQVIHHPGECGTDICKRLGYANRSSVSSNFPRMIKRGYVEDRRLRESQAIPARYYATEAGKQLWAELAAGQSGQDNPW